MEIFIYGAGNRGRELRDFINKNYSDSVKIAGYVDKYKNGTLDGYPVYDLNNAPDKSKAVVISLGGFDTICCVLSDLRTAGFTAVYWHNVRKFRKKPDNFLTEQCVFCSSWSDEVLYRIELHAMDACNLNCIGCTHYAPVFDRIKPDTEKRLRDIELLRKKTESVCNFSIMGGEPFLNDDIILYVQKVKECFPAATAIVVTNGLLIPKVNPEILNYLSKENVCVSISEYEPTHKIIDRIRFVLDAYNVLYEIRKVEKKQLFNIPLSEKPSDEKYCISNGCINIWEGKIARCPTLMYVTELNKKFGLSLPEEGIYDLDSEISGTELKDFLKHDVPLCRHCVKNETEWRVCGKNVTAEHFVKLN